MDLHDPEAHIFGLERDAAVQKAVDALPPRERAVIIARFGLDGPARTLDATALELAKLDGHTVGRARIAQIERKALRHLKARGGLHEVAGLKPPKTLNAAEFAAHQRARQAQRAAAEQWLAQQAADERAAQARRDADAFAAQQRARQAARKLQADEAAASYSPWSNPPQQLPSMHYDWMQSMAELERWRAGGRPVNPFDWTRWMES